MIADVLKDNPVVIDVRSPAEFAGGNVVNSRNIPLQELTDYADELRIVTQPIVFCCASGNRSGMATQMFKQMGFTNVYNGGSWLDVNYYLNN